MILPVQITCLRHNCNSHHCIIESWNLCRYNSAKIMVIYLGITTFAR